MIRAIHVGDIFHVWFTDKSCLQDCKLLLICDGLWYIEKAGLTIAINPLSSFVKYIQIVDTEEKK